MKLLIVTFNLRDLTDADYRRGCDQEAPAFSAVPGLLWKTWLADQSVNTYGGVYLFADGNALDAYLRSELFKAIGDDPTVDNLKTRTFDVLDGPSRVTHALAAVAA